MIPLNDLRAQYKAVGDDIEQAVIRVLRSGRYALGPEVEAFEREFAAFCETAHAVAVNSGTSALYVALRACNVGAGDEVITVPYTFVATVAAIRSTGAVARFVDIDPRSFTMDINAVEQQVTDRTKAIIPVHLFGQPVDMDPVLAVASRHGLTVIEDACQAHGATYKGRPVGSLGDLGCFSFYPSKNLGACGEGGMIVTNTPALDETARMLRNWGQDRPRHHVLEGGNYRLDAVQAAVLRVKLPHVPAWTDARRAVAARYDILLTDSGLLTPVVMPYATHAYHVYAVRCAGRDALGKTLRSREIEVGVHYPLPVHLQPAYAALGYDAGAFPIAEAAAREELSLPIYPEISDTVVTEVVNAIRQGASSTAGGA